MSVVAQLWTRQPTVQEAKGGSFGSRPWHLCGVVSHRRMGVTRVLSRCSHIDSVARFAHRLKRCLRSGTLQWEEAVKRGSVARWQRDHEYPYGSRTRAPFGRTARVLHPAAGYGTLTCLFERKQFDFCCFGATGPSLKPDVYVLMSRAGCRLSRFDISRRTVQGMH